MTVRVKLFAILRERAGTGELSMQLPDGAAADRAVQAVAERFPSLRPHLAKAACAVNLAYAPRSTVLSDGDELALIPAVSGG